MSDETRMLFVLWQCWRTRQFVPVGRLLTRTEPGAPPFEFAYVRGVARAMELGFQPFLAFPSTGAVYRSGELFPFFHNRVLQRTRPDYAAHVESLGLARSPDVIDLLGRSGGRRETDHIEVVPAPRHALETDEYDVHFWVRGVRHVEGAEEAIATLAPGARLACVEDPQNPAAPDALVLCAETGARIGYLPDYLVGDVQALRDVNASSVRIAVVRTNPAPIQPQRRVLCHLRAPWPAGFRPLASDELRPLVEARCSTPAAA